MLCAWYSILGQYLIPPFDGLRANMNVFVPLNVCTSRLVPPWTIKLRDACIAFTWFSLLDASLGRHMLVNAYAPQEASLNGCRNRRVRAQAPVKVHPYTVHSTFRLFLSRPWFSHSGISLGVICGEILSSSRATDRGLRDRQERGSCR